MKKRRAKSKAIQDGSKVAKKRNKIANQLTEDEIFIETVHNALRVPNASSTEKLAFALTSIPEARIDFPHAKTRLSDILDLLLKKKLVTSEEVILLKRSIKDINSIEELITTRVGKITTN
ncbi:MAG: hypothetical protein JSU57_03855 [Candidatus Heimdallarchaeota archaeon]|nr:MAG: hypothetical protein JSU57_03855 [Candidatus Heimdallarchaeota archaeon]